MFCGKSGKWLYIFRKKLTDKILWLESIIAGYVIYVDYCARMKGCADLLSVTQLEMSVILPFLPILSGMTCSMQLHDEICSSHYRMTIVRLGKVRYLMQKLIEAFGTGGLFANLSLMISCAFLVVYGVSENIPITMQDTSLYYSPDVSCIYYEWIMKGQGAVVLVFQFFFAFLYCGLWAVISILFALCVKNKRVSALAPFILSNVFQKCGRMIYDATGNQAFNFGNLSLTYWTAIQPIGGLLYEFIGCATVILGCMVIGSIEIMYLLRRQG